MTGLGRFLIAVLLAGASAGPGWAQAVTRADYRELARELDAREGFETLRARPEPGIALNAPMRAGRLWLGERFAGQRNDRAAAPFDAISGRPAAPLSVRPGAPGRNLSLAYHRGFGSAALFPLGPAGFPALAARGEGAVAVLFDQDQRALGLRVHSDYPDPLGGRDRAAGRVTLVLYARDGETIARLTIRLSPGISEIGLRRAGGLPDIAGLLILNDDPGGIAIDDILYQTAPVTG